MKAVIKSFAAHFVRSGARFVLQRPWVKKRVRDMVTRVPRLHNYAMRVMFEAPVPAQYSLPIGQEDLSPNAQRMHRALKQAIRTRRQ